MQRKEYLSVSSLWETFSFHPLHNALRGRLFKGNASRADIRLKRMQDTPLYSMLNCGFCETASETDNETFPIGIIIRDYLMCNYPESRRGDKLLRVNQIR